MKLTVVNKKKVLPIGVVSTETFAPGRACSLMSDITRVVSVAADTTALSLMDALPFANRYMSELLNASENLALEDKYMDKLVLFFNQLDRFDCLSCFQ